MSQAYWLSVETKKTEHRSTGRWGPVVTEDIAAMDFSFGDLVSEDMAPELPVPEDAVEASAQSECGYS